MHYVGIDFGTTNSYLAFADTLRIAHMSSGDRSLPSQLRDPEGNILHSLKRYLGREPEELDAMGLDYILEDVPRIPWEGRTFLPEELAALFLEDLVREAGAESIKAVLAVPAHYDEAQRRSTRRSAEGAGIEVLRLLHEPTAAALAYGRGDEEDQVLVFDLGGGTLDLSLLEIGGDIFEVIQTAGNRSLGGDDLDLLLAVEIARKLDVSFDHRVLEAARTAKHELSGRDETLVVLGQKQASITRAELENIAAPFLVEIEGTLREMQDANPDALLLVGGMSRMPAVNRLVENFFGMQADGGVDPETAVALGAARYAKSLRGEDEALLLDITPMSLGIETESSGYSVIIPGGSRIPIVSEKMFSTSRPNQASVEINILQGDEADPSDNRALGSVWLRGIPPAPAGVPELWVSFEMDENGMLHVLASNPESGLQEEVSIGIDP